MDPTTNLFRTLQELRGAPLTTLLGLLAIRQRAGITLLAGKIGFERNTVRTALYYLLERGFVTRGQARKWEPTQAARAILDGLIAVDHFSPAAEGNDQNLPIPAGHFSPAAEENDQNLPISADHSSPAVERNDQNLPIPAGHLSPAARGNDQKLPISADHFSPAAEGNDQKLLICADHLSPAALKVKAVKDSYLKIKKKELKTEDPDLNLTGPDIGQNLSPPDPPAPQMDVSRILAATSKLFGEWVLGRPQQYPDARLLLGTIAAAYDNRRRLDRPARVVYANLKAGRFPAQHYLEKPQSYLPADFCRAAGLPSPARPYDDWSQILDPPVELEPESELEIEWPPVEPEALEWFRKLMCFDQALFSWTTYHQYLEKCELISCDLEAGEFVISAEDQLSADWLNARLVQNLQNALVGIAGRRLTVRFEVWPPPGEAG